MCICGANLGLFVRVVCSKRLHPLVSVMNWVFLLTCSAWVMRCTALLCRVILKPFKCGCSHVDRKRGHVSLLLVWHNVQLGF